MENKNELVKIIEQEKIMPTQAEILMATFNPIFEAMKGYELKAREIIVNDISQIDEMKKARQLRLEVSRKRIDANNKRKELKEDYLRGGKAIQSVYNIIEALATPLENSLEIKEKFAENIEREKKLQLGIDRANLLSPFVSDISAYNLVEMSEVGFKELLESTKTVYENKVIIELNAEKERTRIAEEKEKENEKIRIENEKLKAEQKIKDDLIAKQNKEKADLIAKQQAELADEKRKRDEQNAKIAADEKIRQNKINEENCIKKENEDRIAEENRQATLAPDKVKLFKLAGELSLFELPEVNSEKAKEILKNVKGQLNQISLYINRNINNL